MSKTDKEKKLKDLKEKRGLMDKNRGMKTKDILV